MEKENFPRVMNSISSVSYMIQLDYELEIPI